MDWQALMHAGLHHLHLHPDAFWRLSPAELSMMLGGGARHQPLNRERLNALLQSYPDTPGKKDETHG
ncbi:rcc01693 family protein [Yoonia sp. R2331]|uniref:rcc01693 family protein n=1 Tax=Yoonia sp. R2331 TaxID=3237238 RepID=UPI0034E5418F